jgi:hypothetical protein
MNKDGRPMFAKQEANHLNDVKNIKPPPALRTSRIVFQGYVLGIFVKSGLLLKCR